MELTRARNRSFHEIAIMATAIGAVAVGAFAIGALSIGWLAIRRISVGKAKFESLEIRDLTVTRLRADDLTVSGSFKLPGSGGDLLAGDGRIVDI
jgi:hypothetical protein